MNSEAIKNWMKAVEERANPGVKLDKAEEPWPISPIAPISKRARQAFHNIGIMD